MRDSELIEKLSEMLSAAGVPHEIHARIFTRLGSETFSIAIPSGDDPIVLVEVISLSDRRAKSLQRFRCYDESEYVSDPLAVYASRFVDEKFVEAKLGVGRPVACVALFNVGRRAVDFEEVESLMVFADAVEWDVEDAFNAIMIFIGRPERAVKVVRLADDVPYGRLELSLEPLGRTVSRYSTL